MHLAPWLFRWTYPEDFSVSNHGWVGTCHVEITLVKLPEATSIHLRVVAAVHLPDVVSLDVPDTIQCHVPRKRHCQIISARQTLTIHAPRYRNLFLFAYGFVRFDTD
jgi:hypothetical protein